MSHTSTPEIDEYDLDEHPRLELDLTELKKQATQALGVECLTAEWHKYGESHEVYVLRFNKSQQPLHDSLARAGFECIARFARSPDSLHVDKSEVATIRHVRRHTSIPVPEIYHEEYDANNAVGAAYLLMEKLPGTLFHALWDDLSLEEQKSVISQVASVVVELASLRFDQIGSLTEDGLGPVINQSYKSPQGPFQTTQEFLSSFISPHRVGDLQVGDLLGQVQKELDGFLESRAGAPYLQAPFGLVHSQFDGWNLLFVKSEDESAPSIKLTGVIDFDHSYSGPLDFIYEYPIFIQDTSLEEQDYARNAVLRPHFVREVLRQLPTQEARKIFIETMNSKTFLLRTFETCFVSIPWSGQGFVDAAQEYIEELRSGTGMVYDGRLDFQPEYYSEDGEVIDQPHADEVVERFS